MKLSLLLGFTFSLSMIGLKDPSPRKLTPDERKFAINYLKMTRARLLKDVEGLSAAQLSFRPDDTRWSVGGRVCRAYYAFRGSDQAMDPGKPAATGVSAAQRARKDTPPKV